MSLQNIKNEIQSLIIKIEGLELEKLYPDEPNVQIWQDTTQKETKVLVDHFFDILISLKEKKNINILDYAGANQMNNLKNILQNFVNDFSILQSLQMGQIINQHHVPLNQLQSFIQTVKTYGIYSEILLEKSDIKDLQNSKQNAKNIEKTLNRILVDSNSTLDAIKSDLNDKKLIKTSEYFSKLSIDTLKTSNTFLVAFFISLLLLIAFVIYPFFNIVVEIIFEKQTLTKLQDYLFKLPFTLLLIFISTLFYNQFSKNRSISYAYKHKSSVACSLSEYGNQFFDDVNKIKIEKDRNEIIREIIKFKISSTEELFKLPRSDKDEMKFQAQFANNSIGFQSKK